MSDKEIVDYAEVLAGLAKRQVQIEKPSTSNIGTRAGILTYNGDPIQGNKLDGIIIASTHANLYYEDEFDDDNPKNPVCYAYSEDGSNMVPHPSAYKKQSDSCLTCPKNKWKSDPKGGKGKACKNTRTMAILPPDVKADTIMSAEIAVLKLPVTSVKAWQMYNQKLDMLFHRPPLGMVTQIGTVPDLKTQYKITFTDLRPVEMELIKGLLDRKDATMELLEKAYDPNDESPEGEETKKPKKF